MNRLLFTVLMLLCTLMMAQQGEVFGTVTNEEGDLLSDIKIEIVGKQKNALTQDGSYRIRLEPGNYTLKFISNTLNERALKVQIVSGVSLRRDVVLNDVVMLDNVELFGSINKQPEKLDLITRLPLKPSENIQTISTISNQVLEKQGILNISDAVRNAPGVYTYATFGGRGESIGARGYRGIPVLKNGVRIQSDFRGPGFITDMQGIESVQVIKGAATISQGFGLDLGSAGGVVNLVTKVPDFENFGRIDLRYGSWNQVRPTIDFNRVLNDNKTLAFRINGAYEYGEHYSGENDNQRFYVNPSLRWMPSDKLDIKLEMDYLDDTKAPDAGTVNLSKDNTENLIYDLPKDRYLGFESDEYTTKTLTYSVSAKYDVNETFYIKGGLFGSSFDNDGYAAFLSQTPNASGIIETPNIANRSLRRPIWRKDDNQIGQLDFVFHNIRTGDFKHLAQIGLDIRGNQVETKTFNTVAIDVIDVFDDQVSNTLNQNVDFTETGNSDANNKQWGALAQYVVEYKDWARFFAGLRYSNYDNESTNGRLDRTTNTINYTTTTTEGDTWNPVLGLMVYPRKQLGIFASYTNTTNPRNASRLSEAGEELGDEKSNQFEVGFKSQWFGNRLRFNTTYYRVENKNMIMQDASLNNQGNLELLPWYIKGGDDIRQGVELELIGRITKEWEVMMGYSWLNAEYDNATTFMDGSRPNNTPEHVANFWTNYSFSQGSLAGLNIGAGIYYLGDRPYNDFVKSPYHGIVPGLEPWYNDPYTTVNAQIGYKINQFDVKVFFNNIFDEIGYNAYRNIYINRINPRNFAVQVGYNF
ncbi:TonB-dependent siderophore receptor [Flavobacteriaceae bacterium Ap0902]|nr:TonB-dependent siderophore receptor [Flavobacteriaceae bacterium Ap0902]